MLWAEEFNHASDQFSHIELDCLQRRAATFETREIEDIVHDPDQRFRTLLDN
ncbi:MAG: hypothetical protein WDO73_24750 [Ignavibacteriota bacterium]